MRGVTDGHSRINRFYPVQSPKSVCNTPKSNPSLNHIQTSHIHTHTHTMLTRGRTRNKIRTRNASPSHTLPPLYIKLSLLPVFLFLLLRNSVCSTVARGLHGTNYFRTCSDAVLSLHVGARFTILHICFSSHACDKRIHSINATQRNATHSSLHYPSHHII
ncbi:hypothetical protein BGZ63DRAFT_162278 [Mariannaea sp. PMI_226]|nr:hypothetical protein BGZ63DRAFT_162278 [Mariannaea sp. PMI_226]